MRNIAFGLSGQVLNIIMSLVARTVLIKTLGDLYAGIAGNFTNILMVFSLADLGVGTAIIYALYKPIATGDRLRIQALMKLYARAYILIGFIILALGGALTPFIQFFMKTDEAIPHLQLTFMLFVANTAASYFFSYKGTLITANQKNYIVTTVVYSTSIANYIIQVAILLIFRDSPNPSLIYLITLGIQVLTNLLQNVITMLLANRMYPYLKEKDSPELPPEEKKAIFKNVFSMVNYRVGQVVLNGTDSIVISSMIGVVETGIYSNYNLLLTTVKNLLQQVFHAITASVGNLNALESDEKKYSAFKMIHFGNFWMFGWASVCFWCMLNPFVHRWLDSEHVLDTWIVFFLVLNFYLLGMRNTLITFRDTMGIFREGRFVPLAGAIINIVISVLLAPIMGVLGVFIGTTVSIALTMFWLEPIILFKYGFKRNVLPYFARYMLYLAVTAATAFGTGELLELIFGSAWSWSSIILRLVIAGLLPNFVFLAIFFKTREFKQLFTAVSSVINRKLKRGRHAK